MTTSELVSRVSSCVLFVLTGTEKGVFLCALRRWSFSFSPSVSTLTLKPGSYEVRVATRHERADVTGSVHTFVEVPDFNSQPMSLSGLVLFDRNAPTATPAEALGGLLDKAPTTQREFTQSDDVTAFARVYQKAGTQRAAVTLLFRVLDRALKEVTAARLALMPDQLTVSGADGRFKLPLDTLPPGPYVLRLEASGGGAATRRDVRFSVK